MPTAEFEDRDLLNTIQNEKGLDMTDMVVIKKEIVDNKLKVFYRPKSKATEKLLKRKGETNG